MLNNLRPYLPLLALSLLAIAPACGDDKDDDASGEEAALTGDCKTISDACHDTDDGEGDAHHCHELAHEAVIASCSEQVQHCVEVCAAGDGGTHAH